MKLIASLVCSFLVGLLIVPAIAAQPKLATQFDFSSDTTPGARKFYFETIPGHRYTLWRSTDLENWTAVSGYPKTADGLSIEHTFEEGTKEFFQIEAIDDQAPEIASQFPAADAYGIRRFDDLSFKFEDATGIDSASIRLTLGNATPLAVGAAGLTFENNVLTYDSGDAALGSFGSIISITLTVADTLGHSTTRSFSFTLEVMPKVVPNLFVFGSPAAQRTGQKLPLSSTSDVARRQSGPIPMSGADEWQISSVLVDRVVITYTGDSPPTFNIGNYLANNTPVKLTDIFYRKIISSSDSPANKQLTLMTQDVPFAEIAEAGSVSISDASYIYDVDANGTIQRAFSLNKSITFDAFGINRDGAGPFALPQDSTFSLSLPEAHILFTPTLDISLENSGFALQRASIQSRVDVDAALVTKITYQPTGVTNSTTISLHTPLKKLVKVGFLGPVPVWIDLTYTTDLYVQASGYAANSLQTGLKRNFSFAVGAQYEKDHNPALTWSRSFSDSGNLWQPLVLSAAGQVTARAAIIPQLDVKLNSIAGFYVNIDPGYEASVNATGSLSFTPGVGGLKMDPAYEATLTQGFSANLNGGLSILGVSPSSLPALEPFPLFQAPATTYSLKPQVTPLAFVAPVGTQNVSVSPEGSFTLEGEARGGSGPITYQWYQNGRLLAGQVARRLSVSRFGSGSAGTYLLKANAGNEKVSSTDFIVSEVTGANLRFITPIDPVVQTYQQDTAIDLYALAVGGEGNIIYQWYFNGNPIPTGISSHLRISQASAANSGLYWARAQAGAEIKISPIFTITVTDGGSISDGFALIPAGDFQMGDQASPVLGSPRERPVHKVYVSKFFMAKFETSKALWDSVRVWGMSNGHGYLDLAPIDTSSASMGDNYPVHSITWYDMVKWNNARSEKENLIPCYIVNESIYKTGSSDAVVCNFAANGYRLPTEAEWEKAARGG